jgi:putative hemolysin
MNAEPDSGRRKCMAAYATCTIDRLERIDHQSARLPLTIEGKYEVRIAENPPEVAAALKLRHQVFNVEMGSNANRTPVSSQLEFDAYDFKCKHLVVIDRRTGATVGTYRLNTLETARSIKGFYSANEFTIEDLPEEIMENGIEIGRACIARQHRNTKALFLLWKALLSYCRHTKKRYFFGCCSVFTQDELEGVRIYHRLKRDGHFDARLKVVPKRDEIDIDGDVHEGHVKLPTLFDMYLRLGARVCGPPIVDREFGSIDFFVLSMALYFSLCRH